MEEIARERGFDPLVAKNWYSVTNDMIASAKVSFLPPSLFSLSLYSSLPSSFSF